MADRLRQHLNESREQASRLERILEWNGEKTSAVKNTASSVLGNVAAAMHMPATDEVLKNTFANYAFEHQEIAAYLSLITMAETVGDTRAVPLLRQSLGEEEAMARWIRDHIEPTTARFMSLSEQGAQAAV
jgi:ferritin-like metal-binding protein YciE